MLIKLFKYSNTLHFYEIYKILFSMLQQFPDMKSCINSEISTIFIKIKTHIKYTNSIQKLLHLFLECR